MIITLIVYQTYNTCPIKNCLSCPTPGICQNCADRFFIPSCSPCQAGCLTCTSVNVCQLCETKKYLKEQANLKTCKSCSLNCQSCSQFNCFKCSKTYYADTINCNQCVNISCSTCACTDCGNNVIQSGCNDCSQCCSRYNNNCKIIKLACSIGFFLSKASTCELCTSYCLICTQQKNCERCATGLYIFEKTSCFKTCPANTFKYSNSQCKACYYTCKTCVGESSLLCLSCKFQIYFTPVKSCQYCIDGKFYLISENTMICYINCPQGYYNSFYACKPCAINCSTCTGPLIRYCLTCSNGFYFLKSTCVACSQGCSICNSQISCQSCIYGYFMNSNKECKRNCLQGELPFYLNRTCLSNQKYKILNTYKYSMDSITQLGKVLQIAGQVDQLPIILYQNIPQNLMLFTLQFFDKQTNISQTIFINSSKAIYIDKFIFTYINLTNKENYDFNYKFKAEIFNTAFFPGKIDFSINFKQINFQNPVVIQNYVRFIVPCTIAFSLLIWITGLIFYSLGADDTGLIRFVLYIHFFGLMINGKKYLITVSYYWLKAGFLSILKFPTEQASIHFQGNFMMVPTPADLLGQLGINFIILLVFYIFIFLNLYLQSNGLKIIQTQKIIFPIINDSRSVFVFQNLNKKNIILLISRFTCYVMQTLRLGLTYYSVLNIYIVIIYQFDIRGFIPSTVISMLILTFRTIQLAVLFRIEYKIGQKSMLEILYFPYQLIFSCLFVVFVLIHNGSVENGYLYAILVLIVVGCVYEYLLRIKDYKRPLKVMHFALTLFEIGILVFVIFNFLEMQIVFVFILMLVFLVIYAIFLSLQFNFKLTNQKQRLFQLIQTNLTRPREQLAGPKSYIDQVVLEIIQDVVQNNDQTKKDKMSEQTLLKDAQ